jgi:hypothetical protein
MESSEAYFIICSAWLTHSYIEKKFKYAFHSFNSNYGIFEKISLIFGANKLLPVLLITKLISEIAVFLDNFRVVMSDKSSKDISFLIMVAMGFHKQPISPQFSHCFRQLNIPKLLCNIYLMPIRDFNFV